MLLLTSQTGSLRTRAFLFVRVILGVVLLVAAWLKVQGLASSPASPESAFGSSRLYFATIEVEIILGLWLLSGWWARAVRVVSLVCFTAFAGMSLYLGLIGQSSCGCFGEVKVNPWLTLGLDSAAVVALLLTKPASTTGLQERGNLRHLFAIGLGTVAFLVLFAGVFLMVAENPAAALARLRGDEIAVEPAVSDLGERKREKGHFQVQVVNHARHPIRLVGGTSTCSSARPPTIYR